MSFLKKNNKKNERGIISGLRRACTVPKQHIACSDPQCLQKLCAKPVYSGSPVTRVKPAASLHRLAHAWITADPASEKETPGTLADGLFVLLLSVLFAFFFFFLPLAFKKHVGQLSDLP